jgi:hypothetical protein
MTFYDLLANREADPGTWVIFPSMEALKNYKNPLIILRIDSYAIILDSENPFVTTFLG